MFENYLKVALRSLWKYKGYTFINIFGLALGMACSLFIFLWVQDELSYDRFHENVDSLYRVEQDQAYTDGTFHVTVTPHVVGPAFVEEIPEIVNATRLNWIGPRLLRRGEHVFYQSGIRMVDPAIFEMFTFAFEAGDPATALDDPYSIVMTREVADKFFPDGDALGQTITMDNDYEFTVTGVMEDIPHNSSIQFNAVIPFELMHSWGMYNDSWESNSIITMVQSIPGAGTERLKAGLNRVMAMHDDDPTDYMVMPLADMHLHEYFGYGRPMGQIKYVYIFSAIALFVLLIACINFMNLSTARSARRAREIGMRKAVGARRSNVALQFVGETMLLSGIALVFAIGIVALLIGPSGSLTGKDLSASILLDGRVLLGMAGITLFTGLVAGSYPAFVLSAFKPTEILKASSTSGTGKSRFRQTLVVIQFGLSVFLIIGTAVVYQQLNYMKDADLGFNQEHLVYMRLRSEVKPAFEELRAGWLRDTRVQAVTSSRHLPTAIGSNSSSARWRGKDPEDSRLISVSAVGHDFVESLGIEMAEGRAFSRDHAADVAEDTLGGWLINEETARLMNMESVVGEEFDFQNVKGPVVGVMKNFHFLSLRQETEPLALFLQPSAANFVLLRIDGSAVDEALDHVEATWNEIVPAYPFEFRFLDDNFENTYRTETRMSQLLSWFAVIAVLIACLGLIGLAAHMAQQRRKEIGIRKALGASQNSISYLLAKEFLILVVLANVIAWPLAYLASNSWLSSFAYSADVDLGVFAGTGLGVALIALVTVSYQAIRASLADPVEALRAE